MSQFRYPGAQPFSSQQHNIFFGRDKDSASLFQLIRLEPLVVLYGKSGTGKSSLINAGVMPLIREESDFLPIPIRFGAWIEGKKAEPVEIAIASLMRENRPETFLDRLHLKEKTLWHVMKNWQISEDGQLNIILIFDQFEELFTYPSEQIQHFKVQLAELLRGQVPQHYRDALEENQKADSLDLGPEQLTLLESPFNLRVLLSIRSDRMSLLDQLSDYLPTILKNCYSLGPLSYEEAEDAILEPAYQKGNFTVGVFDYEDEAIIQIMNFLTEQGKQEVESFQLQILCHSIEEKVIAEQKTKITPEDLGDMAHIFENYYEDRIQKIEGSAARLAARRLIEEGLIFEEEERRLSLYEGQIHKVFGLDVQILNQLVDAHLVRAEPSLQGGYTYELCHDALVKPILESKKKRKEEERRIAEDKERRRIELEEAERRREMEEKRKRKWALRFALGASILALITLVVLVFAIRQYLYANFAREEAEIARHRTEQALLDFQRAEAQNLRDKGDAFYSYDEYEYARNFYQAALKYTPNDNYLEEQIRKCNELLEGN